MVSLELCVLHSCLLQRGCFGKANARRGFPESLFASTSSPERKYWGFQVFQKALPRVSGDDMPMLFTKNFMRSWINHLSNSDRYLHKAARQVVRLRLVYHACIDRRR